MFGQNVTEHNPSYRQSYLSPVYLSIFYLSKNYLILSIYLSLSLYLSVTRSLHEFTRYSPHKASKVCGLVSVLPPVAVVMLLSFSCRAVLAVPEPNAPAALAVLEPASSSDVWSAYRRREALALLLSSRWALDARNCDPRSSVCSTCPVGQRNAAESECVAAVTEAIQESKLELPLRKWVTRSVNISGVPSGCSYSRERQRAIFNSDPAGESNAEYRLVCIGEGVPKPPKADDARSSKPVASEPDSGGSESDASGSEPDSSGPETDSRVMPISRGAKPDMRALLLKRIAQRPKGKGGRKEPYSIFLMGDSTTNLQYNMLVKGHLFDDVPKAPKLPTLKLYKLQSWNSTSDAFKACRLGTVGRARGLVGGHEVVVSAVYCKQALLDIAMAPDVMQAALSKPYSIPTPDLALLGSSGMHHLVRLDARDFEELDWPLAHFNARIEQGLTGVQAAFPETDLRFFTTHSVCEKRLPMEFIKQRAEACAAGDREGCYGRGDEGHETLWKSSRVPRTKKGRDRHNRTFFSAYGADSLVHRELKVLSQPALRDRWVVVDGHAITSGQCDLTHDGYHYGNAIVREECAELLRPMGEDTSAKHAKRSQQTDAMGHTKQHAKHMNHVKRLTQPDKDGAYSQRTPDHVDVDLLRQMQKELDGAEADLVAMAAGLKPTTQEVGHVTAY